MNIIDIKDLKAKPDDTWDYDQEFTPYSGAAASGAIPPSETPVIVYSGSFARKKEPNELTLSSMLDSFTLKVASQSLAQPNKINEDEVRNRQKVDDLRTCSQIATIGQTEEDDIDSLINDIQEDSSRQKQGKKS